MSDKAEQWMMVKNYVKQATFSLIHSNSKIVIDEIFIIKRFAKSMTASLQDLKVRTDHKLENEGQEVKSSYLSGTN